MSLYMMSVVLLYPKERAAAVTKHPRLTEEQKKKWLSVITNDFMSSEESGTEDENVIHPLAWRSKYVNKDR